MQRQRLRRFFSAPHAAGEAPRSHHSRHLLTEFPKGCEISDESGCVAATVGNGVPKLSRRNSRQIRTHKISFFNYLVLAIVGF